MIRYKIILLLSIIICQSLITFAQGDTLRSAIDFDLPDMEDTTWKGQPQFIFEVGHGVSKNTYNVEFPAIPELQVPYSQSDNDVTNKQKYHFALSYSQKLNLHWGIHASAIIEHKTVEGIDNLIFVNTGILNPQLKTMAFTSYGIKIAMFYELPIHHPKLYVRPYLCAGISQNIDDLPPSYTRVPRTDIAILIKENNNQNPSWLVGLGTYLGYQFSKHFFLSARIEALYIQREQQYNLKIGPIQDRYIDSYNRVNMKTLDFKFNVGIGYIFNLRRIVYRSEKQQKAPL